MTPRPRPLRSVLACVALSAVMVSTAGGSAEARQAPPTTTDPAAAAAGWLVQQFADSSNRPAPDGDHIEASYTSGGKTFRYFDGGTTADVIYALAAAGAGKDKIDAAITYFAAHVAEYTQVNDTGGAPGPSDGQVAKTALAAIVASADPTSFGGYDLLQALKDDQCTAVSGSSTDFSVPTCPAAGAGRNIFASVSESLIILAEARGAAAYGGSFAPSHSAVAYFLSLQCPDGGFTVQTSGGAGCTSDVDATGYAAAALTALGRHPGALKAADSWLRGRESADGSWTAQGGPDVDSTGLAASALSASRRDVTRARRYLISQQVTTGPTLGPGAARGALKFQGNFDASMSVKATADGLLGLVPDAFLATLTDEGAAAGTAVLAPTGSIRASTVQQGGTDTVIGVGFSRAERVHCLLRPASVAVAAGQAAGDGTVRLKFTVPASLTLGAHSLQLTGATSGLTLTVPVRVTAAPAPRSSTPAPRSSTPGASPSSPAPIPTRSATAVPNPIAETGLDGRAARYQTLWAVGLVLVGAALTYAGRRRRT